MAADYNTVTLMGRLTRDPEVRTTQSGKSIANFSIAVNGRQDGDVSFFEVTAWEKLGEVVAQYTNKGSKVLVGGFLRQETWEKDGKKNSRVVVIANEVKFLDSKQSSGESKDVVLDDIDDKPLDLSEIPF